MGETIRLEADPSNRIVGIHCTVCGSEWTEKWRADGTPIYTGGLLTARVWEHKLNRYGHREQACRCTAGARWQDVAPASDRTWRAWTRIRKWAEIRTVRMIIDAARPA
jgi:hypothetical protein